MSQAAVESFLGRIITDSELRILAMRSPVAACQTLGLNLSAGEINCLKSLDYDLMDLIADTINGSICRSTGGKD